MAEVETLKVRVTSVEDLINALKKQIGLLDDKLRQMHKAAALNGGNPMAGNPTEDLEKGLA